jgi:hypothetical protein
MDRITTRSAPGQAYTDIDHLGEAVRRCADYEDLGCTPTELSHILDAYGRGLSLRTDVAERVEIIRGISTERLRELAAAERDKQAREPDEITLIEQLGLPVRVSNALRRNGIVTVGQLTCMCYADLTSLRDIGSVSKCAIRIALDRAGLKCKE